MKNRAVYMTNLETLEKREIPLPKAGVGQVVVKIEYVGICGSDVHYYQNGRIGDFVVEGDFILGHECAGSVVELGEGVTHLTIGDRVALEPGETCGKCEYCMGGRYNLCPDVKFLATPPYHGCFVDYLAHPAHLAFKLPAAISTKEGALIEPLAVGLETAAVSEIGLGDRVIILGAGTIGLTCLLAARAHGASHITVVDVLPKRLEKALELGADQVFDGSKVDTVKEYLALTDGKGADVVIESAGALITTQQTPFLAKRGGVITIVGLAPEDVIPLNLAKIVGREVSLRSIFRYKNKYPIAIEAVAKGTIDVSGLITNEFEFEDVEQAFRTSVEQAKDVVKIVVKM